MVENLTNDTGRLLNGRETNEIIEPAVQEKNVRQTTFILAIAIAAVLAAMWFIHKGSPAKTNAAVTDQQLAIQTAITQLTGIKTENGQADELAKKFYEFADFGQVSLQQLKKNPFNISQPIAQLGGSETLNNDNKTKNDAEKWQIQSILQSKYGNCCMINDELLYKGDKIDGCEVVEIGSDFVRLLSGEQNITLYLQTE